jgi:valyl-tRNA synthetase
LGAVEALERRLANRAYTEKAPKELVVETRLQLETEKAMLAKIEEDLNAFKNL